MRLVQSDFLVDCPANLLKVRKMMKIALNQLESMLDVRFAKLT